MPEYILKTKHNVTIEKEYHIEAPTRFAALDLWAEDKVEPYDEVNVEDGVEQIASIYKVEEDDDSDGEWDEWLRKDDFR